MKIPFFGRRKKGQEEQGAVEIPTSAQRKEPLIEQVPDDELVIITKEDASPAWADVDGSKSTRNVYDPEEGDTDITLPPGYRQSIAERRRAKWKKARENLNVGTKTVLGCFGASPTLLIAVYTALAAGVLTLALLRGPRHVGRDLNIAFIGNSYFFINDFPRLFQQVTGGHIFQDSCLHGSGSILSILKTGNGMYYKWQSSNAMIGGKEWVTEGNKVAYLYDYGACSVPQLLSGQDKMLSYGNQYGHYINDGSNPCLVDSNYLDYENSYNYTQKWDYVVIVDQSKRMCFDDARAEAILGFNYTYGPLLNRGGSIPVIVQPHAFWSDNVNMTGLTDIPTFTSLIMDGAKVYKQFLDQKLTGTFQHTKIAPVGDAYLTVWEEDKDLWSKLFLEDGIHPSGYGSYLYAMVLHATIYNVAPPKSRVVTDDTMKLFQTARKLHANSTTVPDKDEALALWRIARRVVLYGHKPQSLKTVGRSSSSSYEADYQAAQDEQDNQGDDMYAIDDDDDFA